MNWPVRPTKKPKERKEGFWLLRVHTTIPSVHATIPSLLSASTLERPAQQHKVRDLTWESTRDSELILSQLLTMASVLSFNPHLPLQGLCGVLWCSKLSSGEMKSGFIGVMMPVSPWSTLCGVTNVAVEVLLGFNTVKAVVASALPTWSSHPSIYSRCVGRSGWGCSNLHWPDTGCPWLGARSLGKAMPLNQRFLPMYLKLGQGVLKVLKLAPNVWVVQHEIHHWNVWAWVSKISVVIEGTLAESKSSPWSTDPRMIWLLSPSVYHFPTSGPMHCCSLSIPHCPFHCSAS